MNKLIWTKEKFSVPFWSLLLGSKHFWEFWDVHMRSFSLFPSWCTDGRNL